jgi:hypothetical protein
MEDPNDTDLIEQLRLMEKQAHELVAQQYKVERLLKNALEKTPYRHHKILEEGSTGGSDESSQSFSA